ncbi:MAG: hypothetical protein [Tongren Rhabd tick virus 1]|uniref:Uncharacterized protein n=1 Tax=Tongren Rhabd tick virus 1 TaxID=2972325 RepID=A0A9E8AD95_9RHAB|nr:MAG: hypothetical protein [Tongren Rhabd tick virus 1]
MTDTKTWMSGCPLDGTPMADWPSASAPPTTTLPAASPWPISLTPCQRMSSAAGSRFPFLGWPPKFGSPPLMTSSVLESRSGKRGNTRSIFEALARLPLATRRLGLQPLPLPLLPQELIRLPPPSPSQAQARIRNTSFLWARCQSNPLLLKTRLPSWETLCSGARKGPKRQGQGRAASISNRRFKKTYKDQRISLSFPFPP